MSILSGIPHLPAVKAFEKADFWIARQGKHITMTDGERIITIPRANPINAHTMGGIIKDAGLTIKEYSTTSFRNQRIYPIVPFVYFGNSLYSICCTPLHDKSGVLIYQIKFKWLISKIGCCPKLHT